MNRTPLKLILLSASLCVAPLLAHAQDAQVAAVATVSDAECSRAAHLTRVQGRIVEKAVQGIVPLRQFVWGTRMIYQLDLMDTVAWLDQRRALLATCEQRSARNDSIAAAGD